MSIRYDWPRIAAVRARCGGDDDRDDAGRYVDVIVVKHAIPPTEAGLYAAASLGGLIVLYAVGFIPMVLLPQATDRHVRGERTRRRVDECRRALRVMAIAGIRRRRRFSG